MNREILVWYDCETNKIRNIELHGFPKTFDILVCKESPFHDSELDGSNQKKKKINKGKNRCKKSNLLYVLVSDKVRSFPP